MSNSAPSPFAVQFLRPSSGRFLENSNKHAQRNKVLRAENRSCQRLLEKKDRENAQLRARIAEVEQSLEPVEQSQAEQQECSPSLPHEETLPHHGYGPAFIAMCQNLANRI
ncbi:MAG: hypothetical protein ACKPHU_30225, partial [Planctomycetaceae bacterium]